MENIKELQTRINNEIKDMSFGQDPKNLYEPIRYIMSLGGKRIRPLFTLLSYQMFNSDIDVALSPAIAVELFHNFTLMHDDLMDKAPLRRGMPTVHKKWDSNISILAGDVMLVKVYELLARTENDKLAMVLKAFNQCATEVCEGQQKDMDFENMTSVIIDDYLGMIKQKTGALIGFSIELGGILAGEKAVVIDNLRNAGLNIGMGFQLMDDILDVYGDKTKFGKQVGGDIIANKKTYLLLKAFELANQEQKSELSEWLSKDDFDNVDKIRSITQIFDDLEIYSITSDKARYYFDQANKCLDKTGSSENSLSHLKEFTKTLSNREQ